MSREQDQKDREEQERQKKDDEEFQQEDEAGIVMQILDVVLLFQFQWSVMTLRNRYQVILHLSQYNTELTNSRCFKCPRESL